MAKSTQEGWRLAQLRERTKQALSSGYQASANRQVSAVPDARTIRYYSTLGLVDPPAEMRGRTAYYHRRHLLQLVAIKRLQAQGVSLAQIQTRLAGLSNRKLEGIAKVPVAKSQDRLLSKAKGRPEKSPSEGRRDQAFWAQPTAGNVETDKTPRPQPDISSKQTLHLQLARGVELCIDTESIPTDAELEKLAESAQGLLAIIEKLRS